MDSPIKLVHHLCEQFRGALRTSETSTQVSLKILLLLFVFEKPLCKQFLGFCFLPASYLLSLSFGQKVPTLTVVHCFNPNIPGHQPQEPDETLTVHAE